MSITHWLTERHTNTSKALLRMLEAATHDGVPQELHDALETGESYDYDDEVYVLAHRVLAPLIATQLVPPCVQALGWVKAWQAEDMKAHGRSEVNSGMIIAVYGRHVWSAAHDVEFGD